METIDDLLREEVLPIGYTEANAAWKLLHHYATGKPVGPPSIFSFFTMQHCLYAAADIGEKCLRDIDLSIEHRAAVLVELLLLQQVFSVIVISSEPAKDVLHNLEASSLNFGEKIRLLDLVAKSPRVWPRLRTDVIDSLNKFAGTAVLTSPLPKSIRRQAVCTLLQQLAKVEPL